MKNRYIGRRKEAHLFEIDEQKMMFMPRKGVSHSKFKAFVEGLEEITSTRLLEKGVMLSGSNPRTKKNTAFVEAQKKRRKKSIKESWEYHVVVHEKELGLPVNLTVNLSNDWSPSEIIKRQHIESVILRDVVDGDLSDVSDEFITSSNSWSLTMNDKFIDEYIQEICNDIEEEVERRNKEDATESTKKKKTSVTTKKKPLRKETKKRKPKKPIKEDRSQFDWTDRVKEDPSFLGSLIYAVDGEDIRIEDTDNVDIGVMHDGGGYTPYGVAVIAQGYGSDWVLQGAHELLQEKIEGQMSESDWEEAQKDADYHEMDLYEFVQESWDGFHVSLSVEEFIEVVRAVDPDMQKMITDAVSFYSDEKNDYVDVLDFDSSHQVESKKRFNTQAWGSAKYVINYHDGEKTHKDGSDFFDVSLFKNKKDFNKAVEDFKSKGYVEESKKPQKPKRKLNEDASPEYSQGIGSEELPNKYYVSHSGDFYVGVDQDSESYLEWASEVMPDEMKGAGSSVEDGVFDTFSSALVKANELADGITPENDECRSVMIEDHLSGIIYQIILVGVKGKWGYIFEVETMDDTSFTREKLGDAFESKQYIKEQEDGTDDVEDVEDIEEIDDDDSDTIIDDYDEDIPDAMIFEYGLVTGFLLANGYTMDEIAEMEDSFEVFDKLWEEAFGESAEGEDNYEPDGTGPHGKGNGPGKGRKDGSGMDSGIENIDEDVEEKKLRNKIKLSTSKNIDELVREDIIHLAEKHSPNGKMREMLLASVTDPKLANLIKIRFRKEQE